MSEFHRLVVSEIKKETPNSVSILFEVPEDLKEKYLFEAGQYITIKHTVNDKELRRSYSICCTPSSGLLKVGVKKVTGGSFSVFANEKLKEGDALEVMTPMGKFIFSPDSNESKSYIAFAAGSGITPLLSIINAALETESNSTFVLIYGNQSKTETMYFAELMALKERYSERFHLELIFSRSKETNSLFGRIDKSVANYILNTKYKEFHFSDYYLCGPEPMIDEVRSILTEKGVDATQIHFELFSTAKEVELTEVQDGNTEITITLDDESKTFTMSQSKSILDAALAQKIDAPYSCQGGICSTCIARIVEGKAKMRVNQILTDGEIAEGLILTCQAHPTTSVIAIDYDDV